MLVVPLATAWGHAIWISAMGATAAFERYALAATFRHVSTPDLFLGNGVRRVAGAALYAGLFLLPWAVAPARARISKSGWAAAGIVASVWLVSLLAGLAPSTGNVVGRFGLGTCTLGAACAFKPSGLLATPWFWAAATLGGIVGSMRMACLLGSKRPASGFGAYAAGFGAAFLLSLLGMDYYDRYYLVIFPPLLVLAAGACLFDRLQALPAQVLLAAWAVLGTWDHLAWNRAKQDGILQLQAMGLSPAEISGGMDWDARHHYEARMEDLLRQKPRRSHRPN